MTILNSHSHKIENTSPSVRAMVVVQCYAWIVKLNCRTYTHILGQLQNFSIPILYNFPRDTF